MEERDVNAQIERKVTWCREQFDSKWTPDSKKFSLYIGKLSKEVYDGVVAELRKEFSIMPFRLKWDKVTIFFYGRKSQNQSSAPEQSGVVENA